MKASSAIKSKYRINFIIPYFGHFPSYFQLFLNSCERNPDIDWTIVTDNKKEYRYPENVHIVYSQFSEVQERIRRGFVSLGIKPYIEEVYKLCDYKPTYAYIFPELVEGYDYWGYCDVDVIYGNIRKFITDEKIEQYPKIGILGHLSIIRNQKPYNLMFMREYNGELLYKKVLSSEGNYNFDETFLDKPNINDIFEANGIEVLDLGKYIADIHPNSTVFRCVSGAEREKVKRAFFVWNKGRLFRIYVNGRRRNKPQTREFLYIHLQKRKMKMKVNDDVELYKIIPNSFEDFVNRGTLEDYHKEKLWNPNLQYFRIRAKNLITKLKRRFALT